MNSGIQPVNPGLPPVTQELPVATPDVLDDERQEEVVVPASNMGGGGGVDLGRIQSSPVAVSRPVPAVQLPVVVPGS